MDTFIFVCISDTQSRTMVDLQELPLETLLERYEEGTRLAAVCQAKLAEAELKVKQLEQKSGGDFELKPFATGAED